MAVARASGIASSTIERVRKKMWQGWDWRKERRRLERKYRRSKEKTRPKGRPPQDVVFTGDGEELSKKEADAAAIFDNETPEGKVVESQEKEKEEEGEETGGNGKTPKPAATTRGEVPVAGMSTRKPVVTFRIQNEEIALDPNVMFELYFIYLNIKELTGCTESFMEMLKYGLELVWQWSQPLEMPTIQLPEDQQVADIVIGG